MPLNTKAKLGGEIRMFLSSAAQSLLSIDLQDVATESGTVAQMAWEEVAFLRYPLNLSEPTVITDIMKRLDIDHTKRGPQQRKTGSFSSLWRNTDVMIRKYKDKECLIKVEYHVDDAGAVDEYVYVNSARFTGYTWEAPSAEGEVLERGEFVFADWGHRVGP